MSVLTLHGIQNYATEEIDSMFIEIIQQAEGSFQDLHCMVHSVM